MTMHYLTAAGHDQADVSQRHQAKDEHSSTDSLHDQLQLDLDGLEKLSELTDKS